MHNPCIIHTCMLPHHTLPALHLSQPPFFPPRKVINTTTNTLQNVITFPPEGAFVVDSSIQRQGPLRVEFEFTSARLLLPEQRTWKLPPFGKGWFDNVYVDAQYRVAQDSRGDTLVVVRQGEPRVF